MSQRHPFSTVSCFQRFASRDKISHYFVRLIYQKLYYDVSKIYALLIEFYYAFFLFLFFKDMHYNTMIRTFCIMKKMTFIAFHYLNLSIRCEELESRETSVIGSALRTSKSYISQYVLFRNKYS
jgi:hypothetical protein